MSEAKIIFEPQDYVRCQYYGETLNGRILSVDETTRTAEVEICLSSKRGEQMLNDVVTLGFDAMKKIKYVPKNSGLDDDDD